MTNAKQVLLTLVSLLFVAGCTVQPPVVNNSNTNVPANTNSNNANVTPNTNTPPVTGATLDLSNQNLSKLPELVLKRTDLVQLDLSNNNLTGALPAEIRHLSKLQVLKVSN